jgi:8-oxo-dGTP diphosphatase
MNTTKPSSTPTMKTPKPNVRVGVGVFILQSSSSPSTNLTFLLGKRKGSHGSGSYALPGGHLEFGETPEECAAREVMEETGLRAKNMRYLTTTNDVMEREGKHYVTLFMVCERDGEGEEPRNLEPEKCDGWEWVKWEDLLNWVRIENEAGEGEVLERKLFLPLLNLVKQRPGIIPTLQLRLDWGT